MRSRWLFRVGGMGCIAGVILSGNAFAATVRTVEDFQSFGTTPTNVTADPPGTWSTNGTMLTSDDYDTIGLNVEARTSGANKYLHVFANLGDLGGTEEPIPNYQDLGRATRDLGTELTEQQNFWLSFDILDKGSVGEHFNAIAVGVQDKDGTDDGSRKGVGISMAIGWAGSASNRFRIIDLASWDGAGDNNFTNGSDFFDVHTNTADQVWLSYLTNGTLALHAMDNGVEVETVTWTYSGSFSFENLVVMEATGWGYAGDLWFDVDNIELGTWLPSFTRTDTLDDFEGFSTTPTNITADPPGTWSSSGTLLTSDDADNTGLHPEVRDDGGDKYLHLYGNLESDGITTYTGLGRAVRSVGRELTEELAFQLAFDVKELRGDHVWNFLGVGVQDADGTDDGTRKGIAILFGQAHYDPYPIFVSLVDLTSFGPYGGYNFGTGSTSILTYTNQFDELRMSHIAAGQFVLETLSNGTVVASMPWAYDLPFSFGNVIVMEGTGTASRDRLWLDMDNLVLRTSPSVTGSLLVIR